MKLKDVKLVEQANPNQEFIGRGVSFTRQKIFEELLDELNDQIDSGELPEETQLEVEDITDEIAQEYADQFVEELYNTAGERFVEAHMDLMTKTLKKIKVIRRRAIGMKRQKERGR